MEPIVELFAPGTRSGETYTAADLDAMVRNHALLTRGPRPLHEATVVIGHEEDQSLLERTDLPNAGIVPEIWVRGSRLVGRFADVPEEVRDWIRRRLYRYVSIETMHSEHPEFPEPWRAAGADGYVFRRVVLLGAALPKVKGLLPLPYDQFADRPRKLRYVRTVQAGGLIHTFSEVVAMDRKQMEDMARTAGYSDEFLALLDDTSLAALLGEAQRLAAVSEPPAPEPDVNADGLRVPRDELVAQLAAMGQDPAVLELLTDEELQQMLADLQAGAAESPVPDPVNPMSAGGTPSPKSVTMKFADIMRRANTALTQVRAANLLAARRLAAERRATIDSFCQSMVREGRLTPAQVERNRQTGRAIGHVLARLERADAVRRFSDKPSELELQMEEIRKGPVIRQFAEKLEQPVQSLDANRRKALLSASPLGKAVLQST